MIAAGGGDLEARERVLREYISELIKTRIGEGERRKVLAAKIGIDRTTLHRWLHKTVTPDAIPAVRAILALGGNMVELAKRMGDEGEQLATIFDKLTTRDRTRELVSGMLQSEENTRDLEIFIETYLKMKSD